LYQKGINKFWKKFKQIVSNKSKSKLIRERHMNHKNLGLEVAYLSLVKIPKSQKDISKKMIRKITKVFKLTKELVRLMPNYKKQKV